MAFNLNRAFAAYADAKALGPHPSFMDRTTPVATYSPGNAGREAPLISQQEAMRHSDAYGGRQAIDWVYDCIGLYSDPAATAPFLLQKDDGTKLVRNKTKGTPPDHEVGPDDLYRLLDEPNPFMGYTELLSLLVVDLLLVGNGYWLKWRNSESGKPLALYRLSPGYVKIKAGPFGPERYEYQPPGARKPMKIAPADILHFRRPNPHSPYYGMGVIQGAGRSMDLELAITDTMASYYENKADPSLIVQSERRVPRDVFTKLRAQLRARTAGTRNSGELLLLESGLKASTLSTNARDALFQELSTMSRDRIFAQFRVSPMLFGLLDEATGSNKVSDLRREFDNYTLRPFLARLSETISHALTSAWGVTYSIDYRPMLPPEEAVKVGGEIAKLPGVKVRELRRQYSQFGIEESTGDPEIDEYVLNMPTPEADAEGMVIDPATGKRVRSSSVGADRPLPGEAGRPPKGENTRGFGSAGGKALSLDEIDAHLYAMALEQKALNAAGEKVTVGNVLQGEQRPSDTFADARQRDIDSVTISTAAQLRDAATQLERGLLDTVEGKALKTSDIVKRVRQSDAWVTFKERVQEILESAARDAAMSGVVHADRVPEDDVDYDAIVKAVVHRPDGLRSIIKTVRDRVVAKVKEARDSDAERSDYQAAVRAAVSDWSATQAVTVADSEATEAYNEAVLTTLEMSGEDKVYVVEEYDAPDEACQDARGQVWDIDFARQHRKEHPRCRRAFLSVADTASADVN